MISTIKYVICADVETGGLPCKASKDKPAKLAFYDVALVEVALVVIDCHELKIVTEYSNIIKPYKEDLEYSAGAEQVHGISLNHLVTNGCDVKDVFRDVEALFVKYKNPRIGSILAGHNFQMFDIPFFEGLFEFNKKNLWDYVTFVDDTMKIGWYRATEQENYKLRTCCSAEGIELVDSHRALTDTRANAQLFMKYLSYLRGNGGQENAKQNTNLKTRFRESFQLV